MTNAIGELEKDARCIFVIGSNTTENHPVIGMKIKKNVIYNGAKLVVADPRKTDLAGMADVYMQHKPGTDVALVNGMMHVIIKEGLAAAEFIQNCTEGYEAMAEVLDKYTPEYVSEITGVPAEDIIKAARLYAESEAGSICYAMGLTQHSTGTDNVKSVCNLAMLTGNMGRPGTGVNPLRGQNNVQGACDMGGLPVVYTAYQAVTNPDVRAKFEKAWGVTLPDKNGLTLTDAINKAYHGELKALFVLGENPMMSDPDLHHVEEALENLDFLVVEDIFLTETAKYADVVLPSACFAEKDGTFSNTERRVQRVRKAVDAPGEAKADWQILCELATRMGYPMSYDSPEEIFEEIRTLTPSYAGITYERLEGKGIPWPCPNTEHPGTPYLHKDGKFSRGKGLFSAIEFKEPRENPDEEYPLILTTGRSLFHYHTGTMTRRASALHAHRPDNEVEINPALAERMGIADGEKVKLSTRRGSIQVRAHITDMVEENVVFTTFHFAEAAANVLTNADSLDPVAKIPEYKVCAVRLEKVI
jgi:formate dehydrogenase major subunit